MNTVDPNAEQHVPHNAVPLKCKRRWLRFSLRSLLILMLLFGMSFAWVAKRLQQKQMERVAVSEMDEDRGSLVKVNPDVFRKPPTLPKPLVWLERWFGDGFFEDIRGLSLAGTTDVGMAHIPAFPSLRELWIVNSKVTEDGLSPLKRLNNLEVLRLGYGTFSLDFDDQESALEFMDEMPHLFYLQLEGIRLTESGWQRIKCLPKLRQLVFSCHIKESDMAMLGDMHGLDELQIGDSDIDKVDVNDNVALRHISGLKQLKSLTIVAQSVTDDGLKHLAGQTALKRLDLPGSSTTDDGVQQLQKALPHCKISR